MGALSGMPVSRAPNRFCPPPTGRTATEPAPQPPVTAAAAALKPPLQPPSPSTAALHIAPLQVDELGTPGLGCDSPAQGLYLRAPTLCRPSSSPRVIYTPSMSWWPVLSQWCA